MPRPACHARIATSCEVRTAVSGGRRGGETVVRTRLGDRAAGTSQHPCVRATLCRGGRDGAAHRRLAVGENRNDRFIVGAASAAGFSPSLEVLKDRMSAV